MRLSERLMQLARAEGAQSFSAAPHDLTQVLRLLVVDSGRGNDAGRIDLRLPKSAVPSRIAPDAVAIVARNLIENALRHSDSDKIRVILTDAGWMCVENDCPAIPEALLADLSGRFIRGLDAGSGSRLSLAIVRTIADRTGAAMTLTSPLPGRARGFRASFQLGFKYSS